MHGLSHKLKKVAAKYNVNVVFAAKNKVGSVCPAVNKLYEGRKRPETGKCTMNHKPRFLECKKNVVYKIPFTCGQHYVGQTGRCVNIRLREHLSSLKGRPYTHLAKHGEQCTVDKCEPLLNQTTIVFCHPNQTTREIVEAWHMAAIKGACVSHPSVALSEKEIQLLTNTR